jgi:hypothetical protein
MSKFHPTRELLDQLYLDLEKLFTPEKKATIERDPIYREYRELFNNYMAQSVRKELKDKSSLALVPISPAPAPMPHPAEEDQKVEIREEKKDAKIEKKEQKDGALPKLIPPPLLERLQSDTSSLIAKVSKQPYPEGSLGVRRYIKKIIKEDEDGIRKLITLIDMTNQSEMVDEKKDPVSHQLQKNLPHLSPDQIRDVIRYEVLEHFLSCLDGYEDENCSDSELYVATCFVEYYFTIGLSDHIADREKKEFMQDEFKKIEQLTKPIIQKMGGSASLPSFCDEKGNSVVDGLNVIRYIDEVRRVEYRVNQLNECSLKNKDITVADFKNAKLFYQAEGSVQQVTDAASFLKYKEATEEMRKKNKNIVFIGGLQDTLHLIRGTRQLTSLVKTAAEQFVCK